MLLAPSSIISASPSGVPSAVHSSSAADAAGSSATGAPSVVLSPSISCVPSVSKAPSSIISVSPSGVPSAVHSSSAADAAGSSATGAPSVVLSPSISGVPSVSKAPSSIISASPSGVPSAVHSSSAADAAGSSATGAPSVVLSPSISGVPSVSKAPSSIISASASGVPSVVHSSSVADAVVSSTTGAPSVPCVTSVSRVPFSVISGAAPSDHSFARTISHPPTADSVPYVATGLNSPNSVPLNVSSAGSSHSGKLPAGLSRSGSVSAVLNRNVHSSVFAPLTPTGKSNVVIPPKSDMSATNNVFGHDADMNGSTSVGGVPVGSILGGPSNRNSVLSPNSITRTSVKSVSKLSPSTMEIISRRGSVAASFLASGSKESPNNGLLSPPSKTVGSRRLAASLLASRSASALRPGSNSLVQKTPSATRSLNGEEEDVEAFRKSVSRLPSRPHSRLSGSMVQSSNLKVFGGPILDDSSVHNSQSLAITALQPVTPAIPSSRPRSLVRSSSIGSQRHTSAGSKSPLLATSQAHLSTVSTKSPSYAGSLHHLSVPGVTHASVSGKSSSKAHLSQSIIKDTTSISLGKSAALYSSANLKSVGKGNIDQTSSVHSKLTTSVNKFSEHTSKSVTATGRQSAQALRMKKTRVSKEATIIINIKTISGRLIPVEVKPSDTIYQLKSIIQVVEGTPIPLQKLLVKSRKISRSFSEGGRKSDDYIINQLQDPRTISSYDLHDGTSIRLFQKFSTPTASAASVKVKQPAPVKAQLTNPLSIIKSRAASFSSYRSSNRSGAAGSNAGGESSVMSEELVPKKKLRPIQPSPDPSVHVFLKTLEDRKFVMNLKPTDTVYDVKSIVKKMQGVLIADQKLVYKGKVLPDSEKIANIKMNDSTLHLVTRSRRGPPPEGLE
ncbi:unnamed protein product [Ambrosiozyma monospora]|uniref:Unnamed protein product n=1 Tax=Ambrosiozyma monospora TaxID=43982 RepID=A0A9W7DJX3_AMBMO|nr:unnamed protein product [Ambrosiozyma monospora]